MFLSLEQIRAIVDQFLALSNIRPEHIQITLSGRDEKGEMSSIHAGYSLEGFYPQREISGIGASQLPICVMCDKKPVQEGFNLCGDCTAETWNDDEIYGDDWDEGLRHEDL